MWEVVSFSMGTVLVDIVAPTKDGNFGEEGAITLRKCFEKPRNLEEGLNLMSGWVQVQ